MQKFDDIYSKKIRLDVESGPSEADRPLEGPSVAVPVDDAVNIDVSAVIDACEKLLARYQDFLCEFRTLDVTHDRPGLAAILAKIARVELLKFEILFDALREASRAKPRAYSELDALYRLLK